MLSLIKQLYGGKGESSLYLTTCSCHFLLAYLSYLFRLLGQLPIFAVGQGLGLTKDSCWMKQGPCIKVCQFNKGKVRLVVYLLNTSVGP